MPGRDQRKLFQIPILSMQRDDFGDRQISITDDKLLAGSHAVEERAKLILQLGDVHGTHVAIIAMLDHCTMARPMRGGRDSMSGHRLDMPR